MTCSSWRRLSTARNTRACAASRSDEARALLLRPDVVERRLDTGDRAQRPVELAQLDRAETEGVELSQTIAQFDRLGDIRRVELLGDVALDPDHLHIIEIIGGRAKGQPVQDMEHLAGPNRPRSPESPAATAADIQPQGFP